MRYFAIVPAAGDSVRMGEPKLLMLWQGRPLIEHVFTAWKASRVDAIAVVVRPDDHQLAQIIENYGAIVVRPPLPPPDMRASVAFGLGELRRLYAPHAHDAWLVAPADLPRLSTAIINRVIEQSEISPEAAIVPMVQGRRGHPVLFPWHWTPRVRHLESNQGINALLQDGLTHTVDCSDLAKLTALDDIDTPDDLRQLGP